ncbi:Sporulation-specific protease YabG [Lentibacillus sp. JNUCC-1]|uniref:sporulation peptidase YabG n=1 Tax=Lentibacillus sp. JNUCC-1 TaxID=2654513 RepID=UPI0012E98407|nr:sporulation peptidase YabG [Lentibacillus sp. JNUCC-1]MUV38014.1 Sporulation-specific protease YabG [Lentibacillus sp. JNUCC-1]
MQLAQGELVTRISYGHDLLFRVASIQNQNAILHGEELRLEADAPLDDLKKADQKEVREIRETSRKHEMYSYRLFRQDYQLLKEKREYESTQGYNKDISFFQLPAQVLHIDGDPVYLRKCVQLYQQLGLHVHGVHVHEKEMSQQVSSLIEKIRPDILVITGHDSYSRNKGKRNDLRAYRHSYEFVETVRKARETVSQLDELVIFAGACQSHFEKLIRAGANFASSPTRINIHALDPVYIAARIAYTSFMEKVDVWDVLRNTLTGEKGVGGIETKGFLRTGIPHIQEGDDEKDTTEEDDEQQHSS